MRILGYSRLNSIVVPFLFSLLVAGNSLSSFAADEKAPARITALTIAPGAIIMKGAHAKQRLLVSGQPDRGFALDLTGKAKFESSNPKIATVSDEGVITPVANGTVTIRAIHGNVKAETKVTVRKVEDRTLNFYNDVMPILSRLNCNQMGCHGSPKGKSGFILSLFDADPDLDYERIVRARLGRLVTPMNPANSLLITKAMNTVPHGGGMRLKPNQPEYDTLVEWVSQQAPLSRENDPKLERVEVFPKQRVVARDGIQPMLVEAYYSDGSMRDMTDLSHLESNDDMIAYVTRKKVAEVTGTGEAIIMARLTGKSAVGRLSIAQHFDKPLADLPTNNYIDELVMRKLQMLNIAPSELSSDTEFQRRVYLDTLGTLPTPEETRRFLAETNPQRRTQLIDQLIKRPEFVDRRTLNWADLLRVNSGFPIYLRNKGMWTYYLWIRHSMATNKPMDQFVTELLTASGNTYKNGPANFYRVASVNPQDAAEQTSMLFLGVRLDCARCHNHPFEQITWDDNLHMAAFFAGMRRKRLPTDQQDEDVIFASAGGTVRHPESKQIMPPRFLNSTTEVKFENDADPRAELAKWITAPENPWFARNMSNRVWFWLMGRGIVHDPDDFRSTNPPSNPELLDYLAKEFIDSGYDMEHIYRLILNSRTYQLSSITNDSNIDDHVHFSHYPYRQMDAEQTLDALSVATGVPERFPGMPVGTRASQLPDTYVRSVFLDLFGRPMRATTCECERSGEMHVGQSMHLISSEHIESKLSGRGGRLDQLINEKKSDAQIVEELYLAALSRLPTAAEKQRVLSQPIPKERRKDWFEDLMWALLNTKEFLFNH